MDLDIANYDYDDIIKLFNISKQFNEDDLKNAKKQVLASHPDKSGLDKREKHSSTTNLNNYNENYNADKDEINALLIHKITNNKSSAQFNEWFNEQFENFKITNDYEANGYGDWLISNEDITETMAKCKDLTSMNKIIEEKKQILRTQNLVKKRDVCEFNNTTYCDLTNSKPENYSSGLFSKFQYEDLKKAHSESLIPVTNEDYTNNYSSLEDIRNKRSSQVLEPLKQKEATSYLNKSKEYENNISASRAYSLFKQDELNKQKNEKFWSNLKRLN